MVLRLAGASVGGRLPFAAAFGAAATKLQSLPADGTSTRVTLFRTLPADPLRWLLTTFPTYFQNTRGDPIAMAPHQEALWRWLWTLRPGESAPTFIALWPRGGGKSTSSELGAAAIGYYGLRRYALYVSNTQQQADDHLATISTAFERLGVERAINKYGVSRGWRVNRLRTGDGFTMDAVGMDTAIRGTRMDEARPDLIILDDLDEQHDTDATIRKKIATLTRKILPTGAHTLAVMGVQNIPNADGIFAQLADGRADFLLDRTVSGPHPALAHLPETDWYRREQTAEGPRRITLVGGEPTWAGQGRAECEALIAKIGPAAFLVECQHRTAQLLGTLFQREWFRIVGDWPKEARLVRFWDQAATPEAPGTDPDWTVGLLLGEWRGQYWIIDVQRCRLSPKQVEDRILQTAHLDGKTVTIAMEQEPGSSGKTVIEDYQRRVLKGFVVRGQRSTGPKTARATPPASAAEAGNIFLVDGTWNSPFLAVLEQFPFGTHDDDVDALSGAFEALSVPVKRAGTWGPK